MGANKDPRVGCKLTLISCVVLGMTLNCLHRVFFDIIQALMTFSRWSAIKHPSYLLFKNLKCRSKSISNCRKAIRELNKKTGYQIAMSVTLHYRWPQKLRFRPPWIEQDVRVRVRLWWQREERQGPQQNATDCKGSYWHLWVVDRGVEPSLQSWAASHPPRPTMDVAIGQWESLARPNTSCDRLDDETIHIAKGKFITIDIPVTTLRPGFCWWFGSLISHSAVQEKPNIVVEEHSVSLWLNIHRRKTKLLKVNSTSTASDTLGVEVIEEVEWAASMKHRVGWVKECLLYGVSTAKGH